MVLGRPPADGTRLHGGLARQLFIFCPTAFIDRTYAVSRRRLRIRDLCSMLYMLTRMETITMPEHILLAVAWPYASGPRHLGHVAGFGVPSDIFARYHRLKGNTVLMVSGTDEHGTPVTLAADKEGVSPRELADRYNRVIGDDLHNLGLSYDLFTRTTTHTHYRVVQD